MKAGALLLWVTLFGPDQGIPPSGFVANMPVQAPTTWVGEWLVRSDRRPLRAILQAVAGRQQLSATLMFGQGSGGAPEVWIGKADGPSLQISRAGVGGGHLRLGADGRRLVGRLIRGDASGDVELTPGK